METLVTQVEERYTKLRDRIDADKQGEYTHAPARACRHEETIHPNSTI